MSKLKATLYTCIVLWLALGSQIVVDYFISNNIRIIDAFTDTNPTVMTSNLKIVADYGKKYLSEEDKKELLKYIIKGVGIKEYEIKKKEEKSTSYFYTKKQSQNGVFSVELISVIDSQQIENNDQYIIIEMEIYDQWESILSYQTILNNILKQLQVKEMENTIQFKGVYYGVMALEERNKLVSQMLHVLNAKEISSVKENNLYTVYAYTNAIDESILISNKKINLNIAIQYDKDSNETILYLATPIIQQSY